MIFKKKQIFKVFIGLLSPKSDHKNSLESNKSQINLVLDFLRLLQIELFAILKKTYKKLFKRFSKLKYQKKNSEKSFLKPGLLISNVISLT